MSSVTYRKQPAIHRTRGSVPLAGIDFPYRVQGLLWPEQVEAYLQTQLVFPSLHICCGESLLGNVRLDLFQENIDVRADAARLPFGARAFASVLCDPPYSGVFQWEHDMLNEMIRVADQRIIFQHWFIPVNRQGLLKKCRTFQLDQVMLTPDLSVHQKELRACLYDPHSGGFWVAEEDQNGESFQLGVERCRVWQPVAYFGRLQVISVFDRVNNF